MNAHTRLRAERAIALLKSLAHARLRGSDIILPDGRRFDAREFDDCFESGDGEEVIVLIMRAHRIDPELQAAFAHDLAERYIAHANWAKKLAEWEARQTLPLPLD